MNLGKVSSQGSAGKFGGLRDVEDKPEATS